MITKNSTKNQEISIALVGSPNTGKTTLFNALTGLRAKTSNHSGTTVELKKAKIKVKNSHINLIDLPGIYGLNASTPEELVTSQILQNLNPKIKNLDLSLIVVDASNLERGLFLVTQLQDKNINAILILNMIDEAEKHGIHINEKKLSKEIGMPVFSISARSKKGIKELLKYLKDFTPNLNNYEVNHKTSYFDKEVQNHTHQIKDDCDTCDVCKECPFQLRYSWSDKLASSCVKSPLRATKKTTDKIDKYLTNKFFGLLFFISIMFGIFYLIFSLASFPMEIIDTLFNGIGGWLNNHMPDNDLRSLLSDGIIGGVGGILVFLPQICILFFFLSLLEDSGYLARAAFIMDKMMRRVGLPGTAFVPLLSAHACAIPAIMGTRVISNYRERLLTILITPLMTCSARIPVYAMVASLLFQNKPTYATLIFIGAYALGIIMGLVMSFLFKKTILPGETRPLVLELPEYRLPNLKNALLYTLDRALVFIKQAGGIILLISITLWILATYPKSTTPDHIQQMKTKGQNQIQIGNISEGKELIKNSNALANSYGLEHSIAGRLGKFIEPIVKPLGFDWQIGIGIISSFAAREVIVSTLAIVYGIGDDIGESDSDSLYDAMRNAKRSDGTAVFTPATAISLLVFYVLAMQCLPTQAVTKRETNSWKWPIFQLVYMSILAYSCSFIAYHLTNYFLNYI